MHYKKTKTYNSFIKSKYLSLKWKNYFYIYDKLFKKYRNKKIIFVEIGVFSGGSLFMWRNFFGKKAKIIGIDLNPESKKFEKYLSILNKYEPSPAKKISIPEFKFNPEGDILFLIINNISSSLVFITFKIKLSLIFL